MFFYFRYCQLISEKNRQKRLDWCTEQLQAANDGYDDVTWTDESRIQIDPNGTLTFHRIGVEKRRKPKAKHPYSVLVWAGISKSGATPIIIFNGIMDAEFYCNTILKEFTVFRDDVFPEHHR